MKLSLVLENLAKGLSIVSKTATNKTTLPILGNILFKTDKGMLKLSATNLEIGINYWLGAKIEKEGEITIPSKTITEFVLAQDSQETIEIKTNEEKIKIKGGLAQAEINGASATDFPLIPVLKKESLVSFKKQELISALKLVGFASAGINDARPVLSGVYFNFKEETLTLAATDSFRLAEKKLKLSKKQEKEESFIVPSRTVQELVRIIEIIDSEEVEIILEENQVLFKCDEVEIVTRLVEGTFPAYSQIIPQKSETTATVSLFEINKNLKLANVFARDENGTIKIKVDEKNKGKEVALIVNSALTGQLNAEFPAKASGNEVEINLNVRYLLDILNVLSRDTVELGFNGSASPVVLKAIDEKDYVYIIMPLRA